MSSIIRNPSNVVTAGDIAFTTTGGDIQFTTAAGTIVTINQSGVPAVSVVGDMDITGQYLINGLPATGTFADNEIPVGAINGLNLTYSLANNPLAGSEHVYLNGLLQNTTNDYQMGLGGPNVITFYVAPMAGSIITVSYRY